MKKFENCLYVPREFVREITPITNADMQNLNIDLMNKTSSKCIRSGGIEVMAEELTRVFAKDSFCFNETLYKILIPTNDNMSSELTCKRSICGNGWERIRNCVVKRTMEYDSTVKLWSATQKGHPLHQPLPHTIYYEDKPECYDTLRRLGIPFGHKAARKELRRVLNLMHGPYCADILANWELEKGTRVKLLKALRIASHVTPKVANSSKNLSKLVKHSLKTELLDNIETNAYNLGYVMKTEDYNFRKAISSFQEPTERLIPMSFTTTYKTSLYAYCPESISPAVMYDVETRDGYKKNDAALEINVVIQTLTTAWPKKYDSLHEFDHTRAIKDVLPEGTDLTKINVRRNNSIWGRIIRNEAGELYDLESYEKEYWKGDRVFVEKTIDACGLRMRNDAVNMTIE